MGRRLRLGLRFCLECCLLRGLLVEGVQIGRRRGQRGHGEERGGVGSDSVEGSRRL